ncbi:MAG: hypothetical protein B6241_01125 [Spirochaetaceae bacterium 4572_59]|nr:MAG: hypothetical protein B6241_01125 [Spirochaetaceae bacterium 4572_59]
MLAKIFLSLFDVIFNFLHSVFSSYGLAIIGLSIVISILLNLLQSVVNRGLNGFNSKYTDLFDSMNEMEHIHNNVEKHFYIKELYKIHSYKNYYKLLDILPVLIQIPFFIAAYVYLVENASMNGEAFLFLRDLSLQDQMYFNINLLPIFMTIVNLFSGMVYSSNENRKSIQFVIVPLIFLFFLYDKPSSILLYWTMSNMISLGLNLRKFCKNNKLPRLTIQWNSLALLAGSNIILLISIIYWFLARRVLSGSFSVSLSVNLANWLAILNALAILYLMNRGTDKAPKIKRIVGFTVFVALILIFIQIQHRCFFDFCKLSAKKKEALFFFVYALLLFTYLMEQIRLPRLNKKFIAGLDIKHVIPVILVPLYYVLLNPGYFDLSSSIAFIILLTVVPIVLYLAFQIFLGEKLKRETSIILCVLTPVVFYLMPLINQLVGVRAEESFLNLIVILLITICFSIYISRKIRIDYIVIFLSLVILINMGASLLDKGRISTETASEEVSPIGQSLSAVDKSLPDERPSVYFLIYDAYADPDMMNHYGVDNDKQFDYLKSLDFRFYTDVYTLFPASLGSIAKALNMTDQFYTDRESREVISGKSLVDDYLQSVGYETNYVLKEYYVLGTSSFDGNYIFPERVDTENYQNRMFSIAKSIVLGEFKFDDEVKLGNFTKEEWIAKKREIMASTNAPTFLYTHTGPGHSQNSGKCLSTEIDDYYERLDVANKEMTEDIETILEHNPNSIIIIAGDHGPYLKGDCTSLRNYKADEISGDLIRDRFGMFLAIKWPENNKYNDYDVAVLQEAFIPVMAYISRDESLLKYNLRGSCTDKYDSLPAKMIEAGNIGLGKDKGTPVSQIMK